MWHLYVWDGNRGDNYLCGQISNHLNVPSLDGIQNKSANNNQMQGRF